MKLEELEAGLVERLSCLGFVRQTAQRGGPMGSSRVRYSSRWSDVVLHSDRGAVGITMGPRGSVTYGCQPWADLLGLEVGADLDAIAQAEFLLGHAEQIEDAIAHDPDIRDRLRSSNWRFVKEYLGLDPDMQVPGKAKDS